MIHRYINHVGFEVSFIRLAQYNGRGAMPQLCSKLDVLILTLHQGYNSSRSNQVALTRNVSPNPPVLSLERCKLKLIFYWNMLIAKYIHDRCHNISRKLINKVIIQVPWLGSQGSLQGSYVWYTKWSKMRFWNRIFYRIQACMWSYRLKRLYQEFVFFVSRFEN